jgi:hypothetical protein
MESRDSWPTLRTSSPIARPNEGTTVSFDESRRKWDREIRRGRGVSDPADAAAGLARIQSWRAGLRNAEKLTVGWSTIAVAGFITGLLASNRAVVVVTGATVVPGIAGIAVIRHFRRRALESERATEETLARRGSQY